MDDKNLDKMIREGNNATLLMSQLEPVLLAIKAELINRFESTEFNESELRDEVWRKLQALNWLEEKIVYTIDSGNMAKDQLETRVMQ